MIEEIKKLISTSNLNKFDRDEIYNLLKADSDWIAGDENDMRDCSNSKILDELFRRRLNDDDIFRLKFRYFDLNDVKAMDLIEELESRELCVREKLKIHKLVNF